MLYKANNKVILKDDLNTEGWTDNIRKIYYNLNPKVTTIKQVIGGSYPDDSDVYILEEIGGGWTEEEMVGLYEEPTEPINTRFEILDL